MTPFTKVVCDVATNMEHRLALLSQPDTFFQKVFQGRLPSLEEKLNYVEMAVQRMTAVNIYENDIYHVEITNASPFIHIDIRRHDQGTCNQWRHFQQIKNELIGPEYEAIELFPAESRLVDTGNEYHLWVWADPTYRFPLGFSDRLVIEEPVTYRRYKLNTEEEARPLPADCAA